MLALKVRDWASFLSVLPAEHRRIAVLAGNCLEFVVAREAVTAAGRVAVPVNPKLTATEIAFVLASSRASILLVEASLEEIARTAAAESGTVTVQCLTAEAPEAPPLAVSAYRALEPTPIGATLIYTSGTTGVPKGCMRSAVQESARATELVQTYGVNETDVHLIACPLAHSAPGILLRAGMAVGARTFVLPKFRPEAFLAAVQQTRATIFFLVPTQYERLLALPAHIRDRYDLSSIRVALVAGAPIHASTKTRLIDWLGVGVLWEFYGSSETGTIAVLPPSHQLSKPGSVGTAAAGVEMRLLDEDANPVLAGEIGEIYVRSPTVMSGYLDSDGTVDSRGADGFISVGDLGRMDDEGFLYLVERRHDTIITGGVNVYPAEVERALSDQPAVAGAVVFGLSDPDWGQIVAAAVVAAHPEVEAAELAEQLRRTLRASLAPFKIPKAVAVVAASELPVGASGKPLRRRARAELSGRLIRYDR